MAISLHYLLSYSFHRLMAQLGGSVRMQDGVPSARVIGRFKRLASIRPAAICTTLSPPYGSLGALNVHQ